MRSLLLALLGTAVCAQPPVMEIRPVPDVGLLTLYKEVPGSHRTPSHPLTDPGGTLSRLTKTHCKPSWDPLTLASRTFD
jgi:hypothetical protein